MLKKIFYDKINVGDLMNNEIDKDFADINEESESKNYIIVIILYVLVIILTILLIFGIKKQKDVVENNLNQNNINNVEEYEKG